MKPAKRQVARQNLGVWEDLSDDIYLQEDGSFCVLPSAAPSPNQGTSNSLGGSLEIQKAADDVMSRDMMSTE